MGLIVPLSASGSLLQTIAIPFAFGVLIGSVYGLVWLIALNKFGKIQFDFMLTLAVALLIYAGGEFFVGMGTGPVAVLFFGLMLGNAPSFSKRAKKHYSLPPTIKSFHSEITFFVRSFFFVYLGLTASIEFSYLAHGIVLSAGLIIARLAAVRLAMAGAGISKRELNLMWVVGPKGLVAATLAQLPLAYNVPGANVFPNIAFVVILATSIYAAVGAAVFSHSRQTRHAK